MTCELDSLDSTLKNSLMCLLIDGGKTLLFVCYVLVNVRLRVHYGNYWTKGCGREANTARASAASECCIRLETKPLSPIIPVVYERKPYINWFVVHIWSSFEFC